MAKFRSCDDCKHFKAMPKSYCDRAEYNPCQKKHTMLFKLPEGYADDPTQWGFHLETCHDYKYIEPPAPSPPPPAPPPKTYGKLYAI